MVHCASNNNIVALSLNSSTQTCEFQATSKATFAAFGRYLARDNYTDEMDRS